ncbi:large subunit ribosomal protein L7/L12, partial [Paragonimus westermani]
SPTTLMPMIGGVPVGSTEPATTAAEDQQQQPTKSSFTVKLVKFDAAKKVPLIKEIKLLIPEMNLVQAKKFVESAPGNVKVDISKDEAEDIKKTLEAAGATIEIE